MVKLETLFARHRRAMDRAELAFMHREEFPHARPRIALREMYDLNPRHTTASQHYEIDELCEAYIAHCRKRGKFTGFHTPKRGTMGKDGVFRDAEDGAFIQPTPPPEFNRITLRAYRDRIKAYHERLDRSIAEAAEKNKTSGYTDADKAFRNAYQAERGAFADIRDLITRRANAALVTKILGYAHSADYYEYHLERRRPEHLQPADRYVNPSSLYSILFHLKSAHRKPRSDRRKSRPRAK